MGNCTRRGSGTRLGIGALVALAAAVFVASASAALINLDGRVDSDKPAGISPNKDAGELDAVGGTVTPGAAAVPWTVFEHKTSTKRQIFSRAFNGTQWVTKGHGTVNGASSASPKFTSSLNFNQNRDGEAPSIDFAGAGRIVPWATWYEDRTNPFGHKEIFASRFDSAQDKWVFAGQGRPNTGGPPVLNIRTGKDAENPEVSGGNAAGDTAHPGPWITWQEQGPSKDQIFVVKPIGPGTTVCPGGTRPAGGAPVGGFCWQQVGVERSPIGSPNEPSLNVDPHRAGIEPDIAFTGPSDGVPWVVWYEVHGGGKFGVDNERVFAAKAVSAGSVKGTVDGGFHWEAAGRKTSATQVLDTSGSNHAGPCLASKSAEDKCTLNKNPHADAEDPRVAAGTMSGSSPTVPWVVWTEHFKGADRIFVARLVDGTHFELANNGDPLAKGSLPDITFARHTPFVTFHRGTKLFVGHFVNAANPAFKLDTAHGIKRSPAGLTLGTPSPISSDCTANPFNGDGSSCQGGAPGKAFFLFNDGSNGSRKVFGERFK
jgi:hypothetical protein